MQQRSIDENEPSTRIGNRQRLAVARFDEVFVRLGRQLRRRRRASINRVVALRRRCLEIDGARHKTVELGQLIAAVTRNKT